MALPFVLMAAGTALQMSAGIRKNLEQAGQELENSRWLQEQANFARSSMFREIRRTEQEYSAKAGQQISSYAASGVDLSGSAGLTIGGTIASAFEELVAVRKKGELDIFLASARSNLAARNAAGLSNAGTNFMQAGGTLMNNYANTNGFGQGFGNSAPASQQITGGGYGSAGESLLGNNNVA